MFHRHDWQIVSAQDATTNVGGLVTGILYQCASCHKFKRETIGGWWAEKIMLLSERR
jgi:hypothetical protein